MGLSDILLGSPFPAAALMLATATIVAYCTLSRRRTTCGHLTERGAESRDCQSRRSLPVALASARLQLHDLADELDEGLPQQFRLIDRLIEESDREIARLRRRLAGEGSASISMSRREPDIRLLEDFEPSRIAVPAVPDADHRTIRRAA